MNVAIPIEFVCPVNRKSRGVRSDKLSWRWIIAKKNFQAAIIQALGRIQPDEHGKWAVHIIHGLGSGADVDAFVKFVLDGLELIVYKNDKQVFRQTNEKSWKADDHFVTVRFRKLKEYHK